MVSEHGISVRADSSVVRFRNAANALLLATRFGPVFIEPSTPTSRARTALSARRAPKPAGASDECKPDDRAEKGTQLPPGVVPPRLSPRALPFELLWRGGARASESATVLGRLPQCRVSPRDPRPELTHRGHTAVSWMRLEETMRWSEANAPALSESGARLL